MKLLKDRSTCLWNIEEIGDEVLVRENGDVRETSIENNNESK